MTNKEKLGIIAGEGKFPINIAKEANQKGVEVYVICAKNNAYEKDFTPYAKKTTTIKLGQMSSAIKFFKENGVSKAVMAGRVQHVNIFSVMPDLRTAKVLAKIKDMRAETILGAAVSEFKKEGIEFISSSSFMEKCLAQKGVLTKRAPSQEENGSIELGLKISKTMAGLDVGLTCVLCDRAVLALEAMEGTDNCIKRAGEIYASAPIGKGGSIVVVKVARPKQDDRYDLPVIGKGTIRAMKEAKAQVLAIEAQKTIILDIEEVIALADKYNICITAI